MTEPKAVSELDLNAIEAAAMAAANQPGAEWLPESAELEDGGSACFVRQHHIGFEEEGDDSTRDETEEERADTDVAFARAASPQVVLQLIAAARELERLTSAGEYLAQCGHRVTLVVDYRAPGETTYDCRARRLPQVAGLLGWKPKGEGE